MNKYIVNFFDSNGKCYFKGEAIHVDISTYTTIIDFEKTPLKSESSGIFRCYDEMQQIDVIGNIVKIGYLSGQHITIARC